MATYLLIVLGAIAAEALLVCGMVWLLLRMDPRPRRRECGHCRYDLRGLPYGTACPECGRPDAARYWPSAPAGRQRQSAPRLLPSPPSSEAPQP